MSVITTKDLRILSSEPRCVTVQTKDWERPLKLEVTPYEDGVVVQIPWVHRDRLGSPDYEALKMLLRHLYKGSVGTRTETDPRFRRAAQARETSVPAASNRIAATQVRKAS